MKRFICFSVIVIMVLSLSAFAAGSADLTVEADCTSLKAGDEFILNVKLDNVTDEAGVCVVEYTVTFDSALFELVSCTPKLPESWSSDGEDMSHFNNTEKSSYTFSVLNAILGNGAKSGEISGDFKFKVLSDSANGKDITISGVSICNDNVVDIYSGGTKSVTITFGGEASISEAEPDESVAADTSSSFFDDSEPDSSAVSSDASAAVSASVSNESAADNSAAASSDTSVTSGDEQQKGSDGTIWIIAAVLLAAIIAAAVIVILNEKKKKQK